LVVVVDHIVVVAIILFQCFSHCKIVRIWIDYRMRLRNLDFSWLNLKEKEKNEDKVGF
jgi:hypothetical protein